MDHDYTGHNYMDHDYTGHNYTGHKDIGHNYIGPSDRGWVTRQRLHGGHCKQVCEYQVEAAKVVTQRDPNERCRPVCRLDACLGVCLDVHFYMLSNMCPRISKCGCTCA